MHRLAWALALPLLAGCPASTTLTVDGGSGADTGAMHGAWDGCSAMADCALLAAGCCQPCGTPVLSDYDAVNRMQSDAHFAEVCPAPTPCPRCATGRNPNLVAVCESMHCAGVDLGALPLSQCTTDTDCRIRYANCCSCGGTEDEVVAVRVDSETAIEQVLCDGGACAADCAPHEDPSFRAVCDATTGHCRAERVTIGP